MARILAVILLGFVASYSLCHAGDPAAAPAQPKVYLSGGVNFGLTDTYHGIDLTPITLSRDYSEVGVRVSAGVEFSPWLAFEAGWADLGSTSGTAVLNLLCPDICAPNPVVDVDARASTYWAAYAPSHQQGRWRLHATIGPARVSRQYHSALRSDSETTTKLLLGVGATLSLNDTFSLRLDLQRFGDVSTAVGVSAMIRLR